MFLHEAVVKYSGHWVLLFPCFYAPLSPRAGLWTVLPAFAFLWHQSRRRRKEHQNGRHGACHFHAGGLSLSHRVQVPGVLQQIECNKYLLRPLPCHRLYARDCRAVKDTKILSCVQIPYQKAKTTGLPTKHWNIRQRDVCLNSSPKKGKRIDEDTHGKESLTGGDFRSAGRGRTIHIWGWRKVGGCHMRGIRNKLSVWRQRRVRRTMYQI